MEAQISMEKTLIRDSSAIIESFQPNLPQITIDATEANGIFIRKTVNPIGNIRIRMLIYV